MQDCENVGPNRRAGKVETLIVTFAQVMSLDLQHFVCSGPSFSKSCIFQVARYFQSPLTDVPIFSSNYQRAKSLDVKNVQSNFGFSVLLCLPVARPYGTDRQTDRRTDGRTGKSRKAACCSVIAVQTCS